MTTFAVQFFVQLDLFLQLLGELFFLILQIGDDLDARAMAVSR